MAGRPRRDARRTAPAGVILADSSAWIGFLRRTGHPSALALRRLLDRGAEIAVTEVVVMELLAGAEPGRPLVALREQLLSFPMLTLDDGFADFEAAAYLFQACRRAGETVRRLTDCLIAIPAIRAGAQVLHQDRDFDVIARHSPLKIYRPN